MALEAAIRRVRAMLHTKRQARLQSAVINDSAGSISPLRSRAKSASSNINHIMSSSIHDEVAQEDPKDNDQSRDSGRMLFRKETPHLQNHNALSNTQLTYIRP